MDAKLPVKPQYNSQVAKAHKDERKSEKVKDRGDLKKANSIIPNQETVQPVKGFMPDRGDSQTSSYGQRAHVKTSNNRKPEDAKKLPVDSKKIPENDVKILENAETTSKDPKKVPLEVNKKAVEARKVDVFKKDAHKKDEALVQNRLYLDLEGRKRLREKYTLKLRNNQNLSTNEDKVETKECAKIEKKAEPVAYEKKQTDDNKVKSVKSDKSSKGSRHKQAMKPAAYEENQTDDKKVKSVKSDKSSKGSEPKQATKPAKDMCRQRKPLIKTYTLNNDTKMYKAVSFVEEKQQTPLKIKIPNDYKNKHETERSRESLQHNVHDYVCKTLVEDIPVELKHNLKAIKRVKRKKRRILSPELFKGRASPPTEVARWVPSCVNHQTKPYYEAWVDTTLAAISKCTKTDQFLEKNFIKTFQSALKKRPDTPDLVYENYNDERYTGIIKVRQR